MKKKIERVPVRIQLWMPNDVRLDVRAWMDDFTVDNEIAGPFPKYPAMNTYEPTGRRDFTLKAHAGDYYDTGWKFYRGKPKVDA